VINEGNYNTYILVEDGIQLFTNQAYSNDFLELGDFFYNMHQNFISGNLKEGVKISAMSDNVIVLNNNLILLLNREAEATFSALTKNRNQILRTFHFKIKNPSKEKTTRSQSGSYSSKTKKDQTLEKDLLKAQRQNEQLVIDQMTLKFNLEHLCNLREFERKKIEEMQLALKQKDKEMEEMQLALKQKDKKMQDLHKLLEKFHNDSQKKVNEMAEDIKKKKEAIERLEDVIAELKHSNSAYTKKESSTKQLSNPSSNSQSVSSSKKNVHSNK